jgi:hypothetical protein
MYSRVRKTDLPSALAVALLAVSATLVQRCFGENAIYDALVGRGVKVSQQFSLKLPQPVLGDGVAAGDHQRTVQNVLSGRYDWDTFVRNSVVSPFVLKISDGVAESGPVNRQVDIYFVAYGSLKALSSEDYLQKQLSLSINNEQSGNSGAAKILTAEELRKRGIAVESKPGQPRWLAVTSTLLGKVRISLTTQNMKSESADSVVVASVADPRFINDPEYPNCWRSLSTDDTGQRQVGAPQPFVGLGSYVKATRLAEPKEALFIEYHVAFVEPQEWFHGANLLRSKLPIVAQDIVRKFRRNLQK